VRVPVAIDYFGIRGNWLRMTYDSCTTLAAANVALENCRGALVAQCSAAGGTPNAGTVLKTVSPATLNGGRTTLTLSRPGCPGAACLVGSVDVALNLGANPPATSADVSCNPVAPVAHPVGTGSANLSWLRFDWCRGASDPNGGDPQNDPNGRVKFGSPKASYIYMRERY
jgi:hypothetical protein